MKIDRVEWQKRLDEYLRVEYNKANPKPNGMYGNMGFQKVKEREFEEKLKQEGIEVE